MREGYYLIGRFYFSTVFYMIGIVIIFICDGLIKTASAWGWKTNDLMSLLWY